MSVSVSLDFGTDSAIAAQLFPLEISEASSASETRQSHPSKDLFTVFRVSHLIRLLGLVNLFPIMTKKLRAGPSAAVLGHGGFGRVEYDRLRDHLDRAPGTSVAIKSLVSVLESQQNINSFNGFTALTVTQAFIEICVMKHPRLNDHPNILQLLGTADNSKPPHSSNVPFLSLVVEYADLGSLETFIRREQYAMSLELKLEILSDIAAGLHSIHSCDIVHNDMKCSNILLFSTPHHSKRVIAKISDFGCSVLLAGVREIRKAAATRLFAAPEAYYEDSIVRATRDIYSFGIVILHLIMEITPFINMTKEMILECKQNTSEMQKYIHHSMKFCPESENLQLMDTLFVTLAVNPEQRLVNLSFLQPNKEQVQDDTSQSIDVQWLLNVLSSTHSFSTTGLFQKFGHFCFSGRSMFSDSYILGHQLYKESSHMASVHHDGEAALEVALCYAYGVGIGVDWDKCIGWLAWAAYYGNGTALVYLKRLKPETKEIRINTLTDSEPSLDVADVLMGYCYSLKMEGNIKEALIIEQILRKHEPEAYLNKHGYIDFCYCYRDDPTALDNFVCSPDNLCLIPNMFWNHFSSSPYEHIPWNLAHILRECKNMKTDQGLNLLHFLAISRHPDNEPHILRRITEHFIRFGCPLNEGSQNGDTPLNVALLFKNRCVVEILMRAGAKIQNFMLLVQTFAEQHDYEELHDILSLHDPEVDDTSPMEVFRELLDSSACVPFAQRMLMHGDDYHENGIKTMDIVIQYAIQNEIHDLPEFFEEFAMLIRAGNHDMFKYIFKHFFQHSRTVPIRHMFTEFLRESIIFRQQEIFIFLLQQGAEVDKLSKYSDQYPIDTATRGYSDDPFFFNTLLAHGLDITLMIDRGAGILDELIRQKSGAEAIKALLIKNPELIHSREPTTNQRFLDRAILYGYPSTLRVLLEAGADFTDNGDEYYALEAAVFLPRSECIENLKLLLSYEDQTPDPGKSHRLGCALTEACYRGNAKAVELLLQSNADPYFIAEEGWFPTPIVSAWSRLIPRKNEKDYRRMTGNQYERRLFQEIQDLLFQYGLDMGKQHGEQNKTSWEYLYDAIHDLWPDLSSEPSLLNSWDHFDDILSILEEHGAALTDEELDETDSETSMKD